ncbi:hypothetical protein ALC53_00884 [Atta colombica]|uniref:Uncharacterized protein n=1 Tax=Atta colombica TaxID=520822 RepID=A0A195BUY0_9HYME|nr:hypothetical protein ALC53_00884 [Atta colombica]
MLDHRHEIFVIRLWCSISTGHLCEEATEVETHHQQTAATTMGVAEDETPTSLTSSHPNTNNPNQEDVKWIPLNSHIDVVDISADKLDLVANIEDTIKVDNVEYESHFDLSEPGRKRSRYYMAFHPSSDYSLEDKTKNRKVNILEVKTGEVVEREARRGGTLASVERSSVWPRGVYREPSRSVFERAIPVVVFS